MAASSPTLAGFQAFITDVMGVPSSALNPQTAPVVTWCFDFALSWVYQGTCGVPGVTGAWSLYALAVYNLAADTLVNWAQDAPNAPAFVTNKDGVGVPYWAWLRSQYGVNNFVAGVVQSTGDEGTNVSFLVPDAFRGLTIANLGNLKTPYGRAYLGLVASWGPVWGLS